MKVPKFKRIKLESYKPGKSILGQFKKVVKLSANESALGFSPKVKNILKKKINYEKYPDGKCTILKKAISKKFKCDSKKIICGSGSDEIIQMICQLYLRPRDEVIVPEYSFLMYRIYATIVGAKVQFAKEKYFKISIKEILKKVSKKTKIVFIANPNNPTGTYLNKLELLELRKKLNQKILLVVDDAYQEYLNNKNYKSGLELFKNKNNVFILRTFSKIYGLAAMRVGWGYGAKTIVSGLDKIKPPFNVNQSAQIAAIEALKDNSFILKSVKHNTKWANKIKNFLIRLDIFTNDISANFFLLDFNKCRFSANYVMKKLEKKGVILRSMQSYKILNKLRLTIGSSNDNSKFIKEMKKIFNR